MFYFTCNPQESRHFFHTSALLSKTIATYVHVHMKSNPYSLIFPMDRYLKHFDFTVVIKNEIKL